MGVRKCCSGSQGKLAAGNQVKWVIWIVKGAVSGPGIRGQRGKLGKPELWGEKWALEKTSFSQIPQFIYTQVTWNWR